MYCSPYQSIIRIAFSYAYLNFVVRQFLVMILYIMRLCIGCIINSEICIPLPFLHLLHPHNNKFLLLH